MKVGVDTTGWAAGAVEVGCEVGGAVVVAIDVEVVDGAVVEVVEVVEVVDVVDVVDVVGGAPSVARVRMEALVRREVPRNQTVWLGPAQRPGPAGERSVE